MQTGLQLVVQKNNNNKKREIIKVNWCQFKSKYEHITESKFRINTNYLSLRREYANLHFKSSICIHICLKCTSSQKKYEQYLCGWLSGRASDSGARIYRVRTPRKLCIVLEQDKVQVNTLEPVAPSQHD